MGPSIRGCHFEVDKDVKDIFTKNFAEIDDVIISENGKYYIDTVEINKRMLLEAGLQEQNIIDSGICTVCSCNKIHSYRGNNKTKLRNTAIISLI